MTPETEMDQSQHDLMIVVVQGQDADMAIQSLTDEGISVTRLPSVGGFLGRKNATLMIDIETEQYEKAIDLLNKTCRQRVAFIAVPMESAPLPMPAPTPITIGGANVFSLEVEHYEEF
ncbi:cyclic-di-AMP receptor [Chloroflexota bacterium]|nr:cyclic-di-AMP receptor [Chloroflexota bacterium]